MQTIRNANGELVNAFPLGSITRDMRFPDNDMVTPASVTRVIQSRAHAALLDSIRGATSFRVFVARPDAVEELPPPRLPRITRHLLLLVGGLQPQAMVSGTRGTFVPIFDDNGTHAALATRLGLARAGDDVLISFFPHTDGQPACVVSINAHSRADGFMAEQGVCASCARFACAGCGILTDGRLKCGACRGPVYCGRECQLRDWRGRHRSACAGRVESA